jgi:hypothetical protein
MVAVWVGVTSYLPNLIFVAVIIFLLWVVTRAVNVVIRETEKGTIRVSGFEPPAFRVTRGSRPPASPAQPNGQKEDVA